jgi:hypothetical protein
MAGKKLEAKKSSLKMSKDLDKNTKTKKDKKEKVEIPLRTLKEIYKMIIEDELPEADDEKIERRKIISAIKKVLR